MLPFIRRLWWPQRLHIAPRQHFNFIKSGLVEVRKRNRIQTAGNLRKNPTPHKISAVYERERRNAELLRVFVLDLDESLRQRGRTH